jgi:hypothetical protein
MNPNPPSDFLSKTASMFLTWLIGSIVFLFSFRFFGWLVSLIITHEKYAGDAAALAFIGLMPCYLLIFLAYVSLSVWSLISSWSAVDFYEKIKRIVLVFACCGLLSGLGLSVYLHFLQLKAHAVLVLVRVA